MSENPWLSLPWRSPFVLPQDAAGAVDYYTMLPPGPWYGPITTARVIILMLMPGVSDQDFLDIKNPDFMEMSRQQLTGTAQFPWHLQRWSSTGGGMYWWTRLRHLVQDAGQENVSQRLAIAQILPYHSPTWLEPRQAIPSQIYTASLVRQAMARGALFAPMVGWKKWLELVPELEHVDIVRGNSQRASHLSPRNLGSGYGRVLDRLGR